MWNSHHLSHLTHSWLWCSWSVWEVPNSYPNLLSMLSEMRRVPWDTRWTTSRLTFSWTSFKLSSTTREPWLSSWRRRMCARCMRQSARSHTPSRTWDVTSARTSYCCLITSQQINPPSNNLNFPVLPTWQRNNYKYRSKFNNSWLKYLPLTISKNSPSPKRDSQHCKYGGRTLICNKARSWQRTSTRTMATLERSCSLITFWVIIHTNIRGDWRCG